mgnify:CR=1 FL=1
MNVAATPVILLTVTSGVPVNPPAVPEVFWFKVATRAAATVPEAILVPLNAVILEPSPTNQLSLHHYHEKKVQLQHHQH